MSSQTKCFCEDGLHNWLSQKPGDVKSNVGLCLVDDAGLGFASDVVQEFFVPEHFEAGPESCNNSVGI